jgi:hypothetical protein
MDRAVRRLTRRGCRAFARHDDSNHVMPGEDPASTPFLSLRP